MTKTVQPCSRAFLNKAEKNKINKPEDEDNRRLLLSVFDSLNKLYDSLNRLNSAVKRKNMEQNLYRKGKELSK